MEIVWYNKKREKTRLKKGIRKRRLIQTTQQKPHMMSRRESGWPLRGSKVSECPAPDLVGSVLPEGALAPSQWHLQWQQCQAPLMQPADAFRMKSTQVFEHETPDAPGNKAPWVSSVRWRLPASTTAFSVTIFHSLLDNLLSRSISEGDQ